MDGDGRHFVVPDDPRWVVIKPRTCVMFRLVRIAFTHLSYLPTCSTQPDSRWPKRDIYAPMWRQALMRIILLLTV